MFKPIRLGNEGLEQEALKADRKACRKIGPCGVGEKALYLNSFFIDRRYYVPFTSVTRVFKRVAMSKGGFSGRGMFASVPYLVVVYDGGLEKQCNFKREEQVDQLLEHLRKTHPEIKLVSAKAEARLLARERERAARRLKEIPEAVQKEIDALRRASAYLEREPERTLELSQAARRKRNFSQSKPAYKWVALAISLLGLGTLVYGVWSLLQHQQFAIYFTLFGLAAIFLFSSANILPTAQNNRKAIYARADRAKASMAEYIADYPDFPLPARYAHPVVIKRMVDILEEGRAKHISTALNVLKQDLRALNASVRVDQDEFEEIMAIKPMFLNEDYE